jgi:hypothetical protein
VQGFYYGEPIAAAMIPDLIKHPPPMRLADSSEPPALSEGTAPLAQLECPAPMARLE